MSSSGLHPLARQAVVVSQRAANWDWAQGMAKYLSHDSPEKCVGWAWDFVGPHLYVGRICDEAVLDGMQFLVDVLADPAAATLNVIEQRTRQMWDQRTDFNNVAALARLLWAALGAADLAQTELGDVPEPVQMLPSDETRAERSLGLVWDQSAMAIQMAALDRHSCMIAAQTFTGLVCFSERPADCKTLNRFEWAWNQIAYDLSILEKEAAFFVEFCDRTDEATLFSGPFTGREDLDNHLALLMHTPKSIRFVPSATIK